MTVQMQFSYSSLRVADVKSNWSSAKSSRNETAYRSGSSRSSAVNVSGLERQPTQIQGHSRFLKGRHAIQMAVRAFGDTADRNRHRAA